MELAQYGGQVSRKEDLWTPSAILDSISILFRFRLQIFDRIVVSSAVFAINKDRK
jgi:hypothetical protein